MMNCMSMKCVMCMKLILGGDVGFDRDGGGAGLFVVSTR